MRLSGENNMAGKKAQDWLSPRAGSYGWLNEKSPEGVRSSGGMLVGPGRDRNEEAGRPVFFGNVLFDGDSRECHRRFIGLSGVNSLRAKQQVYFARITTRNLVQREIYSHGCGPFYVTSCLCF